MNNWKWKKKEALAEQLKFFGAKKQGFISVYAKKPRILCKAKAKPTVTNTDYKDNRRAFMENQLAKMNQAQRQFNSMNNNPLFQLGLGQSSAAAHAVQQQSIAMRSAAMCQARAFERGLGLGINNGLFGGL